MLYIVLLLVMFVDSSASRADGILRAEDLNSNDWPARCEVVKAELSDNPYADLLVTRSVELRRPEQKEINAFGFLLSVPFTIDSVLSDVTGTMGTLVLWGPQSQRLVVGVEDTQLIDNYWADESSIDLSRSIFGETYSYSKEAYDGLHTRPSDITCDPANKSEDAKRIAVIKRKSFFRIRSPNIESVYDVAGNDWRGFAICFREDSLSVLQFDLLKETRNITGTIKAIGECETLWPATHQ